MNTIRKRGISAFLFLSLLMSATLVSAQGAIVASGKYITKNVKVSGFDRIQLKGSPTIEYTQSSGGTKVQVTGSDNLVDLIECRVEGSTLIVNMKPHTNISYGKAGRLKVLVSSPSLRSAFLQGSGDIYLGNLKAEELEVSLAGSGDIVAGDVTCNGDFSALLKGSGDIDVKGQIRAKSVSLTLQGSGDLNVVGVTGSEISAMLQGSGDLKVRSAYTTSTVTAKLSGSGDMDVLGIRANNVAAQLAGSGDMTLSGSTRDATLVLSRSGELNARKLDAENVTARVNGSGDITCVATKTLVTNIQGSGEISYKGNPSVRSTGKNHLNRL